MPTDFETALLTRKPKLEALQADLKQRGIKYMMVHLPDTNGQLRTKITGMKLGTGGDVVNCNLFCVSHGEGAPIDIPIFEAAVASEQNGYPNMLALADPDTVRIHGWNGEWASVILDSFRIDGTRNPLDMRGHLARQQERASSMGYEARFALEYEFGIFHADEELLQQRRYRELKPWGQDHLNYSVSRCADFQPFFAELMDRLGSMGIALAAVTTEYGRGMYEIALPPKPPLEAADDAARMKLVLQDLCLERNLIPTFMARFQRPGQESACGAHHHQSLWRDNANAFAAGINTLTDVARAYLGGLLAYLPDTHLAFRPTINSYRRFEKGAWSPTDVSWGFENRMASVRAITMPIADAARFEHRVPGADIDPYLTVTAMLAAGLEGIERQLDPDAACGSTLASTLESSIEAFRSSAFVESVFGTEYRDHHISSRENEVQAFRTWMEGHITQFEFQRYFRGI